MEAAVLAVDCCRVPVGCQLADQQIANRISGFRRRRSGGRVFAGKQLLAACFDQEKYEREQSA